MSNTDISWWSVRVVFAAMTCGILLTKCEVYPKHREDDAPQIEVRGDFVNGCDTSYIPEQVLDSAASKCYPEDNQR